MWRVTVKHFNRLPLIRASTVRFLQRRTDEVIIIVNVDLMKAELEREEGRRSKLYIDSLGVPTCGIGRNLRDVGLSGHEIEYLLENDIQRCMNDLDAMLPWWRDLDDVRQRVMLNMCFQLGIKGLQGFTTTLTRIHAGKYDEAAEGMLESLWAKQTPARAQRMANMMKTGRAP